VVVGRDSLRTWSSGIKWLPWISSLEQLSGTAVVAAMAAAVSGPGGDRRRIEEPVVRLYLAKR